MQTSDINSLLQLGDWNYETLHLLRGECCSQKTWCTITADQVFKNKIWPWPDRALQLCNSEGFLSQCLIYITLLWLWWGCSYHMVGNIGGKLIWPLSGWDKKQTVLFPPMCRHICIKGVTIATCLHDYLQTSDDQSQRVTSGGRSSHKHPSGPCLPLTALENNSSKKCQYLKMQEVWSAVCGGSRSASIS